MNAIHCPRILVRIRDGNVETKHLDVGGPVLGLLPDAVYLPGHVHIQPGGYVVLYSHGLKQRMQPEEPLENRVSRTYKEVVWKRP